MAGFEDMLKSLQWNQDIQRSLGLSSQISEMFKHQKAITRSLSGATMMSEMVRSMQHRRMVDNPMSSVMEAIIKSTLLPKFAIPQSMLEAIENISRRHEQLFGSLGRIAEALTRQQLVFSQINSWQFATAKLSGQLASLAASRQKWDLIDDFEAITEEAASLNEIIFNENGVTREGLNELKDFFQRIEAKVDKIDADANSSVWKFIAILSFILSVLSEVRNWLPKPEYATKQEVVTTLKEQLVVCQNKLKEEKQFKITTRKSAVRVRPQMKSTVIETLPVQFEVTVILINHNWIYVSYISPDVQLPRMGWILKKYLMNP